MDHSILRPGGGLSCPCPESLAGQAFSCTTISPCTEEGGPATQTFRFDPWCSVLFSLAFLSLQPPRNPSDSQSWTIIGHVLGLLWGAAGWGSGCSGQPQVVCGSLLCSSVQLFHLLGGSQSLLWNLMRREGPRCTMLGLSICIKDLMLLPSC